LKSGADEGPFTGLAAPARRALAGAGFRTLAEVAAARREDLAALHGMGPNALSTLQRMLQAQGLDFRP